MEVLIGGAILAGVGLAGARMFRDQKMAQKKVDHELALSTFHQGLTKVLTQPQNCNATLKDTYWGNPIVANGVIPRFQKCTEANPANCANLKGEANFAFTKEDYIITAANPEGWIDNTRYWRIRQISVPDTVEATGPMRISVLYEVNPNLMNRQVRKDILLNVRLDENGNYKECYNPQESAVNNLQNDICEAFRVAVTSTGSTVLATWDQDTQTCVTGGSVKSCGPGHIIAGIDDRGAVKCLPTLNNGKMSDTDVDNNFSNCNATNNTARIVFEDGVLSIKCY